MINLRGRGSDTPTASTSEPAGAQKAGERALNWFPNSSTRAPGRGVPGTQGGCLPSRALQTGVGQPRSTRRGAEPLPWAVGPHCGGGAPQRSLSAYSLLLSTPGAAGPEGGSLGGDRGTHRDHDRVFSLKLGDVLIAAVHFGLVERPEATHHFDVALRRVRHLPGCRGPRPGPTPRRSVLEEVDRAEGASLPKAEDPRSAGSRFPGGAAGAWAAAPGPARSPTGSLPTHHGSRGGGSGGSSASPLTGGAGCWAEGSRRPGAQAPSSS